MSLQFESDAAARRKAIADAQYMNIQRLVHGQAKDFSVNGKIAREKAGQKLLIGCCFKFAAVGVLALIGIKLLILK